MEFNGTQTVIRKDKYSETVLYNGFEYKMYEHYYPLQWIHEEKFTQSAVCHEGLSSVRYYDTDDLYITRMDHIEGESLAELAKRDAPKAFDILAKAFKKIHKVNHWSKPLYSFRYSGEVMLKGEDRDFATGAIGSLGRKYGDCFCHLNLDLNSILLTPDGEDFIVVNWKDARLAAPVNDYAATYILLEESSKEHLELYKQIVLPQMWESGVLEQDFEDSKKIRKLLHDSEESYNQRCFGYQFKLIPALEDMGFEVTPGYAKRDQLRVYSKEVPSIESVKEMLSLLTVEQEFHFWDMYYGSSKSDPGRFISIYSLGTHVVYCFGNHGWSSGYKKASYEEMAELIVKNWTNRDGLGEYNFKNFVLIKPNNYAERDKHLYNNAE